MPHTVTYRILDQSDGRFSVVAATKPDRVHRRGDFATLAEAEEWIDGLRMLMSALGEPVARVPPPEPSLGAPALNRVASSDRKTRADR